MPLSIRPKAGEKLVYGFILETNRLLLGTWTLVITFVLFPFACGGVGLPHANFSAVVLLRELETNSLMT